MGTNWHSRKLSKKIPTTHLKTIFPTYSKIQIWRVAFYKQLAFWVMFQGFDGIFSKKPLWGGAGGAVGSPWFDSNTHQIVPSSIGCWKMDFRIFHLAIPAFEWGPVLATSETRSSSCRSTVWQTQGFFLARVRKNTLPNFLECKCQFCRNDFSFVSSTSSSNTSSTLAPCQYHSISSYYPISILESRIEHAPKLVFFVVAIFLHAN